MSSIISIPGIESGGERITRRIDGVGELVYENYAAGQWATKKGEPGKKSRRRYLLDGVELDSVSTIVGTLAKPALSYWIEDQATRGAVQAERLGELADVPEEDWCRRVKSLGLGATAKRDEGADRGTIIHAAFHALAVDGTVPNPADFPGIARPWVKGAMRAWLAMGPGDVIASEEIVCHPELGYAGRYDLVRMVAGRRTLLDFKTGKARIFSAAHWQARLYAMALERLDERVDRILLIGVGDDGGFELIDCAVSEDAARALVGVCGANRRIESDMRCQRSTAKAAAA